MKCRWLRMSCPMLIKRRTISNADRGGRVGKPWFTDSMHMSHVNGEPGAARIIAAG